MAPDVAIALRNLIQGLSVPVFLLTAEGTDLVSGRKGPAVPPADADGPAGGWQFFRSRVRPGLCWAVPDGSGYGGDFFLLLDSVLFVACTEQLNNAFASCMSSLKNL